MSSNALDQFDSSAAGLRKILERIGWVVVVILILTALVAISIRSHLVLTAFANGAANAANGLDDFDVRYVEHPLATLAHLIPGFLIVLIGPTQFIRSFRKRWSVLHRWAGRVFIVCGTMGALTGFFIGALYPFTGFGARGFNQAMATVFIASFTLCSLYNAYSNIRARCFGNHREWMIRAWAIMLSIATERIFLGIMGSFTPMDFADFFGTTFWVAAVIHIIVAEYWINLTRTSRNGARHWKDLDRSSVGVAEGS